MSEVAGLRRVVTGLDAEGRSCVVIDGPVQPLGPTNGLVWRTEAVPADNSGAGDCAGGPFTFEMMHGGGTIFMVNEYQPGVQAYWHATDTTDYIVMLEGEVVLELEAGEVRLKAGDFLVDRGVIHSWRNDSGRIARAAIVTIPARPVGKGKTV